MTADLSQLHPQTRAKVEQWLEGCAAEDLDVRVYSTYRSFAEQQRLRAAYEAGTGPLAGRPGHSFHNVRRAVDFLIYGTDGRPIEDGGDRVYAMAGELALRVGLKWGGDWQHPDYDHVEDELCVKHGIDVGPQNATHFAESGECQA